MVGRDVRRQGDHQVQWPPLVFLHPGHVDPELPGLVGVPSGAANELLSSPGRADCYRGIVFKDSLREQEGDTKGGREQDVQGAALHRS